MSTKTQTTTPITAPSSTDGEDIRDESSQIQLFQKLPSGESLMTAPDDLSDSDDDTDPWERLAAHRDVLKMCIEEDVPFADRAERLLERLDEEGH